MLNDLSGHMRAFLLVNGMGMWVIVGAIFGMSPERGFTGVFVAIAVGLLTVIATGVWWLTSVRSREARLVREVTQGSEQIMSGAVTPRRAIGRVAYGRRKSSPGFLMSRGGSPAPSQMVVVGVVGDGAPRRVALAVPAAMGGMLPKGTAVALALHPTHPEVAVLEDRVTPQDLAAINADPRWATERLPTNLSVIGGPVTYAFMVLGMILGVGLGWLLVVALG